MDSLPLTVCPSQLQLQSTADQSLAATEAKLLQAFLEEGFITDNPLSDQLPFPTTIPDPAPPSPSPITEAPVPALSNEAPLDEDFFSDLLPFSTDPYPLLDFSSDPTTDFSAALLAQWESADASATTNHEAPLSTGPVSLPLALGQAPATPDSSTRRSSDDGHGNPDPAGWGWVPVATQAPGAGPAPGYMTPPGSGKAPEMAMATAGDADVEMMMAMEMELEGMDWEALLSGPLPALALAPTAAPAPVFFPAPVSAPATAPLYTPAPTTISPLLPSPTKTASTSSSSAASSPTKPKATKAAAAADRRERKVTTRRRRETTKVAPGTFVFAENIVPPPEVYHSAYTHTREYCLDAKGKRLRRRRYEDKV